MKPATNTSNSELTHVKIPTVIYKLPIQGLYEVSILALVYNFNSKGFRLSNGKTAKALSVHKRTIERAISNLKKQGYIKDIGTGKNDRCLVLCTDKLSADTDNMSVGIPAKIPTIEGTDTDILADHNKGTKEEEEAAPFSAFVDLWNSKGNLPQIKSFTPQRKRHLQARMGEPLFSDNWQAIIERLSKSSFCTGNNNRGWKVDIDWILKDSTNYTKVLEGKYDNKTDNGESAGMPAPDTRAILKAMDWTDAAIDKFIAEGNSL
jgi:DNA-binding Lrp family transcriptional regulator